MTAHRFAWKSMMGLTLGLAACAEPHDASENEDTQVRWAAIELPPSVPIDAGFQTPEVYFGDVIANYGELFQVRSGSPTFSVGVWGWDSCASNYPFVGRQFDANGFWLCARRDLTNRTFYVGDVEANWGYYYRVSQGAVTPLPAEGWDVCPAGATLLGTHFHYNGFWVCMSNN